MKTIKKYGMLKVVIASSILVAVILIIGTVWMGQSASFDTEKAVRNVSLLYLEELAERREQVVSTTLSGYISNMDVTLGLLEKDDLSSVEKLQAYQARMKQLYGLEKFAFVDENGLIYTSRGTRNDIENYSFDYQTLSYPEISVKNMENDNKKLIIAMPVDNLQFEGHALLVCFMEIDMERFLQGLSLQTDNNSTTFCNIYTSDGDSLTNVVLGGLATEGHLIKALENADFDAGYDIEYLKRDFAERREGLVSFTYNDINETMYYVPVRGSDWMLTYLIRESVISDQISMISEGIIRRSVAQSLLTTIVLIVVFVIMIGQTRKAMRLSTDQAVNEELQQELEERLALQDELLQQEKKRTQQSKMITALSSDYRSVYYVNLDNDNAVCYRKDQVLGGTITEGSNFKYKEAFSEYAEKFVKDDYKEAFLAFIEPDAIRKGIANEQLISIRYMVERNGEERYEMLRMAGVRQPEERDDNKIHAVGVGFSDIDAEMRESMQQSQALSDALKVAEEASKAKTVFLSSMSHEIRTPMNAIIGLDSLALHDPDISDSTRGYLEKIGGSAHHLLSLINDILDMSRIESGRMVIKHEEFAFPTLLEQINTIMSGQCQEKKLSYNCHINGQLDDYYIGDSTKLRQVLINILGNAVKFTPEGGEINFTIEKTAAFDKKSTLLFTIEDNGIGMSKEFLPKLFDTFSQENVSAGKKYGSSGLGMAITKNIVEMMNGKIEVESEKGVGTKFKVTVTLMDSDKKILGGEAELEIRPQDINVLVVDDDEVALEHAKMLLEQTGFKIDTCLSGKEAVEMAKLNHARQTPYNLVIVDWQMPEMNGVETTREIREATNDESTIIILTSYNWDAIYDEAIKAGVDSFVAKPLFTGNLIEEFEKALKKKKTASAVTEHKAELEGRRILLAEDMEINAEIMIEVLEMRDIQSEHAENGKIAVDMFASHEAGYYDAILMDMQMPEMNGLEATAAIRAMDREDAKTIPIIALTANAFDEDVQRSLQAGLNAHLSKPVEPDVLFETLERMIK